MAEKEKELRRMNRTELIEIIYVLQQNEKALRAEITELRNKLDEKILLMSEAGSIAEAALGINRIFDAAQAAADQYLESVEVNFTGRKKIVPDKEEKAAADERETDEIITEAVPSAEEESIQPKAERVIPAAEAEKIIPKAGEEKLTGAKEEKIHTEKMKEASAFKFEADPETAKFKSEMDLEFERILNSVRAAADEYLQLSGELDIKTENRIFPEEKADEKITEENTSPGGFEDNLSEESASNPNSLLGAVQNRINRYLKFGKKP